MLCEKPQATKDLMAFTGRKDRTKFKRSVIHTLIEDSMIEYTIPDKPQSRLQKYRLTAKGRRLAASLAKKKGRS